ncbi:DUF6801 domain-containing protein [Dermacoccus nishinomiyaensis]|uniref:DUF6801 domain-containing protein n=1 Tax=Dermacoccus nishinomiyaensis TaxID=1274 RepID=UPI0011A7DBE7|nr:DUF6801 domain-containing protein [Dermacoccus nishinomiyaensis]
MSKHSVRPASRTRRGLASLGALSLVGGASLIGVAAMAPSASAATELVYTCDTAVGAKDVTVAIDTNAPTSGTVGSPITVSKVRGQITLPGDLGNAMAGFLGWNYVSGSTPNTVTIAGPDGTTTQDVQLTTAKTHIFNNGWVNDGTYGGFGPDGHLVLPLAGSPDTTMTPKNAGTYTISAPDRFTSTFTGTKADGTTASLDSACTYKSGTKVVDSITVTASAPSTSTTTSTNTSPTTSTSTSSTSSSPTTSTSPTAPSTSTASSTAMPSPSHTTGGGQGPKVETDYVGHDSMNLAGIGLAAAGVVAIGGAAFAGRREN